MSVRKDSIIRENGERNNKGNQRGTKMWVTSKTDAQTLHMSPISNVGERLHPFFLSNSAIFFLPNQISKKSRKKKQTKEKVL